MKRTETLAKAKFGRSDMMVTRACIGSMTWGSFNGESSEAFAQVAAPRRERVRCTTQLHAASASAPASRACVRPLAYFPRAILAHARQLDKAIIDLGANFIGAWAPPPPAIGAARRLQSVGHTLAALSCPPQTRPSSTQWPSTTAGRPTEGWIGQRPGSRVEQGKLKRSDIYIATKSNPARIGGPDFPIPGTDEPDKKPDKCVRCCVVPLPLSPESMPAPCWASWTS